MLKTNGPVPKEGPSKSSNPKSAASDSENLDKQIEDDIHGSNLDLDGVDPPNDPGKMFIGGLSWQTTAEGLRDYFSKFGEVNECMVMRDPATKRARGFGFITFAHPSSVDKVLAEVRHELDNKKIDPKVAFPKRAQPKMVVRTKKVFIGGLSSSSTLEDMKNYFQQFGKIEDAMLMYDKSTQRHRGFGFITFDDDDVSDRVCEIHFHEINGKMVECKKAQPKEVMLPVQINKNRAAAARNLYGLTPEHLLAFATYMPTTRLSSYNGNMLIPGMFNGFQQYGISPSGRSSTSNSGAVGANNMTSRDFAAAQLAAQQQAVFEAFAYTSGMSNLTGQPFNGQTSLNHQQPITNAFNKM
uniref:RNA-binding protein Musashi n=1 Tax=Panagrellus redivivus TaxID=6233 RepID=A0A7E4W9W5_PANRE